MNRCKWIFFVYTHTINDPNIWKLLLVSFSCTDTLILRLVIYVWDVSSSVCSTSKILDKRGNKEIQFVRVINVTINDNFSYPWAFCKRVFALLKSWFKYSNEPTHTHSFSIIANFRIFLIERRKECNNHQRFWSEIICVNTHRQLP